MTTAKEKTYVTKTVTAGLNENTLDAVNAAAKAVGASGDAAVSTGGGVQKGPDSVDVTFYSVTFTWSEEI